MREGRTTPPPPTPRVLSSQSSRRYQNEQPSFTLGVDDGTPSLLVAETEVVTTAGGVLTCPGQQRAVTLEEALVLPPGTSLAPLAPDEEAQVSFSDIVAVDVVERQAAVSRVGDSYGGGQILLEGRVVTGEDVFRSLFSSVLVCRSDTWNLRALPHPRRVLGRLEIVR